LFIKKKKKKAEAVAVPVDSKGAWQPHRIDLDSSGEVVRLGTARPLLEGSFLGRADKFEMSLVSNSAPKSPKCNIFFKNKYYYSIIVLIS
jgi:hypothetical protein